jgi:hypothetical protein
MTYRTEGKSPLEHFNLVMDEIRAGRGLVRPPTEEETRWRTEFAPAHVDGVKVLMVIVSRFGTDGNSVENYELLLKATYGDGGWIGKGYVGAQDPNVKIQGPGYPTFVEFYGKHVRGVNYVRDDRIDEAELAKIIYGEAVLAGGYDQIHIVGHGSEAYGMLFYPLNEKGKRVEFGHKFQKKKAMILCKYHSWPLNAGGKVLLVGCHTDRGPFYEFIVELFGIKNVYGLGTDWECRYAYVGDDSSQRFGALDWYYKASHGGKGQHPATSAIGGWLNVPSAREYD